MFAYRGKEKREKGISKGKMGHRRCERVQRCNHADNVWPKNQTMDEHSSYLVCHVRRSLHGKLLLFLIQSEETEF